MPKKLLKKKSAKKSPKKIRKAKKSPRKASRRASPRKIAVRPLKAEKPIGSVTHFFNHIGVAIVKFKKPVKAGAAIKFKGATTDFEQNIVSMQYNHKPVAAAKKNQEVGIKVKKKVRQGDAVFSA